MQKQQVRWWVPLLGIVLGWLLILISCKGVTSPTPHEWLLQKWCAVDSLTRYAWTSQDGSVVYDYYISGTGVTRYQLQFVTNGSIIPAGAYVGRFGVDSLVGHFNLPGDSIIDSDSTPNIVGWWRTENDRLYFMWPYIAGPNWFWEIAKHTIVGEHWGTELNYTESLVGHVYVSFTWETCQ
jgi:hypothetical protein